MSNPMTQTEGQTTTEAKGAKPRLSARQREMLETIEKICRPQQIDLKGPLRTIPANMMQLGGMYEYTFQSERDFEMFLKNLEARGFVRIERVHFVYITDAGKAAVGAKTP